MDLVSDAGLVAAANQALGKRREDETYRNWTTALDAHLQRVKSASEDTFKSEAFQKALWESEAISATGLGRVPTNALWRDTELLEILWRVRNFKDGASKSVVTSDLVLAWDAAVERIKKISDRVPRLKLARVFAALRAENFTTVASQEALLQLARELGVGTSSDHRVVLHQSILDRLDEILDQVDAYSEPPHLLRLKLAWLLYGQLAKGPASGVTVAAGEQPGEVRLRPLPADRRRRGMLAIAGMVPSVLAMIQFAKDGCSREDFKEHVRAVNPKLAVASVSTNINALIAEWGVLATDGDRINLTPRGAAFLESGDPDDVSDWLLTQILGFDNALYLLSQQPREHKTLLLDLQGVNPGWTTNFAPNAMINWLRGLGLIAFSEGRTLDLTSKGKDWANQIRWVPGQLERPPITAIPVIDTKDQLEGQVSKRPTIEAIVATFPKDLVFETRLIAQLDAALWSHPRRHFVILTGLSGAGKTQLACSYASALRHQEATSTFKGTYVLPVQPGWHDSSPILGYVNPLNSERYVRTGFLNFLLDAVRDPERIYTVILDEMNLSHPEQYFAPLLSAMETGGQIELHSQDDDVDEIPASVSYPHNLLIIGTVNMDETTHGLSDKVLDRASVIEFWDIDTDRFPGWDSTDLSSEQLTQLKSLIKRLGVALSPARLHFGWRTVGDVIGYVRSALSGGAISFAEALDHAVYAKVLPKLRGEDSPRLRKALAECASLLKERSLTLSAGKIGQLEDDLTRVGTARFWR
jgi:5-methylcytosine-specific restriction protein B